MTSSSGTQAPQRCHQGMSVSHFAAVLLVVLFIHRASAFAAEKATPPTNWIAELPTVESVRNSTPAGKDARDTALRRAAAFVVWQDLIEVFTGIDAWTLANSMRGTRVVDLYGAYALASHIDYYGPEGRNVNAVLDYSNLKDFRRDVLARSLTVASQQAYWKVRSTTMPVAAATISAEQVVRAESSEVPERVQLPLEGPSKGHADAKVNIVVFSDFQGPFDARLIAALRRIEQDYPNDVRILFRNSPLPMHPDAELAAEAAAAAQTQGKFWQMHDKLFDNQNALRRDDLERYARELGLDLGKFNAALEDGSAKKRVAVDLAVVHRLNLRGTPVSFVNGRKIQGAAPYEDFKKVIDDEIGRAAALAAAALSQKERPIAAQKPAAEQTEATGREREADSEQAGSEGNTALHGEINVVGIWSALHYCPGGHDVTAGLYQFTVTGRMVRFVHTTDHDCGPPKSAIWEGQTPEDTVALDLPRAVFHAKAVNLEKSGPKGSSTKELTFYVVSADRITVAGLSDPLELRRGDVRKEIEEEFWKPYEDRFFDRLNDQIERGKGPKRPRTKK
jgi:protein-disulfide isomerase